MKLDSARKRSVYEWFGMTEEERFRHRLPFSKKELAQGLGISEETLHKWYRDYQKMLNEPKKEDPPEVPEVKPTEITPEEIAEFRRLLFDIAKNPKASNKDRELAAKMVGVITERQEKKVTIELTADELTRRNLEADRQLREVGYRVEEGKEKPTLLPKNIRKDT